MLPVKCPACGRRDGLFYDFDRGAVVCEKCGEVFGETVVADLLIEDEQWCYDDDSEDIKGPISAEMLLHLAACGEIGPETIVCRVGYDQPLLAKNVQGLLETGNSSRTSEPIAIECPKCQRRARVPSLFWKHEVTCIKCKHSFKINKRVLVGVTPRDQEDLRDLMRDDRRERPSSNVSHTASHPTDLVFTNITQLLSDSIAKITEGLEIVGREALAENEIVPNGLITKFCSLGVANNYLISWVVGMACCNDCLIIMEDSLNYATRQVHSHTVFPLMQFISQWYGALIPRYRECKDLHPNQGHIIIAGKIQQLLATHKEDADFFGGMCEATMILSPKLSRVASIVLGNMNIINVYLDDVLGQLYQIMFNLAGVRSGTSDLWNYLQEWFNKWRENARVTISEIRAEMAKKPNEDHDNKLTLPTPTEPRITPDVALKEAMNELDAQIGLQRVKLEVKRLSNYLQIQQQRRTAGLLTGDQTLHFVFTGNPGTGKTTVARIIAKLLYGLGLRKTDKLIETDKAGMIGKYVGETAPKVEGVVTSALDGVLFIDEAYSLTQNKESWDYGREAIDALLKRMEDFRDRLTVIVAGYPRLMKDFLNSNPGLTSRFTRNIHFDDYSPTDLCRIFEKYCRDGQYVCDQQCLAYASVFFLLLHAIRNENFGNARDVRNVFEEAVNRQAERLSSIRDSKVDREELARLDYQDIPWERLPRLDREVIDLSAALWKSDCPGCNQTIKGSIQVLGRAGKCKKCNTEFKFEWWNLLSETVRGLPES